LCRPNQDLDDDHEGKKYSYLNASNIGSRLRSAVSLGSLNHDFIGIALSGVKTS